MKKIFTVIVLILGLGFGLQAQHCSSAKATADKASCAATCAAKAADADASVVKRVNLSTGETYYVRKDVCPASGKVSFTNVEFCSKSKKFVNASPSEKASCSKKATSEDASNPNAVKTSNSSAKPACCASKAKTAACCASKTSCGSQKASTTKKPVETSKAAKATLVNQEQ